MPRPLDGGTAAELGARVRAAYGDDHDRLVAVKRDRDPKNPFSAPGPLDPRPAGERE